MGYETFGIVVIEAFACGVSVLAKDISGIRELVSEQESGLLFKYKDSDDLAQKAKYLAGNKDSIIKLGKNARRAYEERYTLERNYNLLMGSYKTAIESYQN